LDNLGEILRQARLEKGKSLEEIAEETKIRVRYLQAIEEGRFDLLPGHFYTRGFIKSYAEAVGLDPDELLASYLPPESKSDGDTAPLPPRSARHQGYRVQPKPSFFAKGFSSLLLVAFVGLIVIVIYWFWSSQEFNQPGQTLPPNSLPNLSVEDKEPTSPPLGKGLSGQTEEQPLPDGQEKPGEAGENAATQPTAQLKLIKQEGQNDYYELTGNEIAIQIQAKERCWVELRANHAKGPKLFSKELQPGETLNWPGEDQTELPSTVRLRIGAPSAIQLTINGQAIETGNLARPQNYIIQQVEASR
jgi:cytoskeletal protein RodZ